MSWLTVNPTLWSLASLWQSQCYNHSAATSCPSKDRYLNSGCTPSNQYLFGYPPSAQTPVTAWCNAHFALTGIRAPYLDVFISSALLSICAHPLLLCAQLSLNDKAHKAISSKKGYLVSVLLQESDVLESTNYNKISCMLAITDIETYLQVDYLNTSVYTYKKFNCVMLHTL